MRVDRPALGLVALALAAFPRVVHAQATPADNVTVRASPTRLLTQRLEALEADLNASRMRLLGLQEQYLDIPIAGSRARIVHDNEMGPGFRLVRVTYVLDGLSVLVRESLSGIASDGGAIDVFQGNVRPGPHTLVVTTEYQPTGFGLFPYVRGYTVRARAVSTFTAPEGRAIELRVTGYDGGGPTTPLGERTRIRFSERIGPLRGP